MTDPTAHRQLAELTALVARVDAKRTTGADFPSPKPREGQEPAHWRTEVAQLRAQNDAQALESARCRHADVDSLLVPVAKVAFHSIDGEDATVAARVYVPATAGPHPALVLLHGGAFWMGGGSTGYELNDHMCRRICAQAEVVVVNLDYRLAPEHPFPAQYDDVAAAFEWLVKDPDSLGIDPDRLGLMGISSGGNAAASTALALAALGQQLSLQLLLAPCLDLTGSSPSIQEDPIWVAGSAILRDMFLQGVVEPDDARVSPALAPSFVGVAPAVVVVGTHDPLRDDGKRYVAALEEAGIGTELHEFVMTHTDATAEVSELVDVALVDAVRRYLHA